MRPEDRLCPCLDAHYHKRPHEPEFHREEQDTGCDAWKQLLEVVDRCAADGERVFAPGREFKWEDWSKIVTLPPTIAKLTRVRELHLYGSYLVRIPPEIGDMQELEVFDVYTSYRLHWLPFEITRCTWLRSSTVSTRAIYGNYKNRLPFPRLPSMAGEFPPKQCSVCGYVFGVENAIQRWISLRIATDVVALLVHACSQQCIDRLPASEPGYVEGPHTGGLDLVQPPSNYM